MNKGKSDGQSLGISFATTHLERLYSEGGQDTQELEMVKQATFTIYAGKLVLLVLHVKKSRILLSELPAGTDTVRCVFHRLGPYMQSANPIDIHPDVLNHECNHSCTSDTSGVSEEGPRGD